MNDHSSGGVVARGGVTPAAVISERRRVNSLTASMTDRRSDFPSTLSSKVGVDEIQLEGPPFREPIAASREFLRRMQDAESEGRDFAVETTLASRTYIPRARRWTSFG